jgi:DNA-binding transcriptional LysR family regulator
VADLVLRLGLIRTARSIPSFAKAPDDRRIESSALKPIRVVVIELNGMLTDIVTRTLESAPDIVVTVVPESEALAAANAMEADVAVLAGPPVGLPPLGRELLAKRPWMHVVAIRSDGRDTSLYELRPFEHKLGEISPASLLDAVRRVGAGA